MFGSLSLSTKAFVGSDKTALSVTVFSFGLWGLAHLGLTRTLLLAAWFGRRRLCQFRGQVTNSISFSLYLENKKYLIFLESKWMTPHWGRSCSLPFLQVTLSCRGQTELTQRTWHLVRCVRKHRNKDSVLCVALFTEISGHCQKMTQTLTVCL